MTSTLPPPHRARMRISVRTLRKDRWWIGPLVTTLGLAAFVVYATARVFQQNHYWVEEYHYLTPFYSPCLSAACEPGSAVFGTTPWEFPWFIPFAAVTLPILLLFRVTCYYYRKAYYRSIWQAPTACAVQEPHDRYTGETRTLMLGQNLHRYLFYGAALITVLNAYDAAIAMFHGADGGFGIGVGNLILWANVAMLVAYTYGCHSCRHVMGGRLAHFSNHPVRYWLWTKVSWLNNRHMLFAWISLGTLALTDLYVALVASGVITDLRIFN